MFWYNQEIERLEKEIASLAYEPKMIFYGSSTFTLWNELTTDFNEYNPLNIGFGGSTLAACTWYFDRLFKNIKSPEAIIIYAGENDLGEGRHPEEIILFLENLLAKIRNKYGQIPCSYISTKPSVARWHLAGSIRFKNSTIKELMSADSNFHFVDIYELMLDKNGKPNSEYFLDDGLHLNSKGYKLWLDTLNKHSKIFPQKQLVKI